MPHSAAESGFATYRHNITEQMRRLKALRLPSFRPIVTIRPELSWASSEQFDQLRALQRARPTISRIELVAQCG
ncbi:hypothetical protein BQ8794_590003 [Mesorhizobium prunaredense]|uniref:Uncharacterized protein n=1 Tax=Mesorhizobium prunaredense TaxID=1631249 RepID=A0A1R3VFK2_9HYPH|nr:hypothetical protein BQ8794_590003 [Mesorhizobium prunaredense]